MAAKTPLGMEVGNSHSRLHSRGLPALQGLAQHQRPAHKPTWTLRQQHAWTGQPSFQHSQTEFELSIELLFTPCRMF